MNSISRNVYIDKLADIVIKHNNTYHSTIKIKPVDVKSSTYIDIAKDKIKQNLGQKKQLREKLINYMSNRKDIIIYLIVGLIKSYRYMK